jgi:hypothetical protein
MGAEMNNAEITDCRQGNIEVKMALYTIYFGKVMIWP